MKIFGINLYVLLIVTCLCPGLRAQTYSYLNYPDTGMRWHGYRLFCVHGFSTAYPFMNYIKEDTLIDGLKYYYVSQTLNTPSFIGYVRQDSAKVLHCLYRDSGFNWQEAPFCDFSLNVGDSLVSNQYTFYVNLVDTPIYNGIPRKTLHVTCSVETMGIYSIKNDIWIDGIGSTLNPMGIYGLHSSVPYCGYKMCRIETDDFVYFENPDQSRCTYPNKVNIPPFVVCNIFPNPAGAFIVVNTPENTDELAFQIYNIAGKLMFELVKQPPLYQYNLAISALHSGMYFLKVSASSGESSTLRFVKD